MKSLPVPASSDLFFGYYSKKRKKEKNEGGEESNSDEMSEEKEEEDDVVDGTLFEFEREFKFNRQESNPSTRYFVASSNLI